jgi:hypothetical protein
MNGLPVPMYGSNSCGCPTARRWRRHISGTSVRCVVLVMMMSAMMHTLAADPASAEAQVRERNVIRKQLPKTVNSLALEYTIISVDDSGTQKPVDPHAHIFNVGDSFVVRIKPQDDVYVYVFNEGPTGERACLLPTAGEQPLLVKSGVEISLPDDGGFFTFSEPAGAEKLVVVALSEPNEDLRLLSSVFFTGGRAGNTKLSSEHEAATRQIDAGVKALRERAAKGVQSRGPIRKVVERSEGLGGNDRITHVEPPADGESSSYGIAVAADTPELFLDISLRSTNVEK